MSAARSGVRSAAGSVEEVLEHLVHDGAAHGVERRLLGQPVDGAEAVHQRAGHEVARPARRDRPEHVDPVHGRGDPLGGRLGRCRGGRSREGDRHDAAQPRRGHRQPEHGGGRLVRAGLRCGRGSLGSRRVRAHRSSACRRRPAAPAAPARHAAHRVDRRDRRPHHLLVVRRRAADLAGVRAAHRGRRTRSGVLEVRRRLRVRGRALPLGPAPRGVARGHRPASGLRRQLDHAALPRRHDGDRRAVAAPSPRVLDRRRRPAHLDRGRRCVRRRGLRACPTGSSGRRSRACSPAPTC